MRWAGAMRSLAAALLAAHVAVRTGGAGCAAGGEGGEGCAAGGEGKARALAAAAGRAREAAAAGRAALAAGTPLPAPPELPPLDSPLSQVAHASRVGTQRIVKRRLAP